MFRKHVKKISSLLLGMTIVCGSSLPAMAMDAPASEASAEEASEVNTDIFYGEAGDSTEENAEEAGASAEDPAEDAENLFEDDSNAEEDKETDDISEAEDFEAEEDETDDEEAEDSEEGEDSGETEEFETGEDASDEEEDFEKEEPETDEDESSEEEDEDFDEDEDSGESEDPEAGEDASGEEEAEDSAEDGDFDDEEYDENEGLEEGNSQVKVRIESMEEEGWDDLICNSEHNLYLALVNRAGKLVQTKLVTVRVGASTEVTFKKLAADTCYYLLMLLNPEADRNYKNESHLSLQSVWFQHDENRECIWVDESSDRTVMTKENGMTEASIFLYPSVYIPVYECFPVEVEPYGEGRVSECEGIPLDEDEDSSAECIRLLKNDSAWEAGSIVTFEEDGDCTMESGYDEAASGETGHQAANHAVGGKALAWRPSDSGPKTVKTEKAQHFDTNAQTSNIKAEVQKAESNPAVSQANDRNGVPVGAVAVTVMLAGTAMTFYLRRRAEK